MAQSVLGIDVSKQTLDVRIMVGGKPRHQQFANSDEGLRALLAWLKRCRVSRVHACLEATGPYSMKAALVLHYAGHVVSLINPAQIRDFARTKLGRNKTDTFDCGHIRHYGELFQPPAWTPPSAALRRLCELQTMRDGFVASRVEWSNRLGSSAGDATANALARATFAHSVTNCAVHASVDGDTPQSGSRCLGHAAAGAETAQEEADRDRGHAQTFSALLRRAENRQAI